MDRWHVSCEQKVLRVHKSRNGQPSFHSRGARHINSLSAVLKVAYPEKKLHTQPAVQSDKEPLNRVSNALRPVSQYSADERLLGLVERDFLCCLSAHILDFPIIPRVVNGQRTSYDLNHWNAKDRQDGSVPGERAAAPQLERSKCRALASERRH